VTPLPWLGDNLLLLDELRVELSRASISEPVLLRASEQSKLERVLAHGTDRAGYSGDKRWCLDSTIAHEDVILATTPEQNRDGEADPAVSTSLKKFSLIADPMLLIYAAANFERLRDNHWRFREPTNKPAALRAVFPIAKLTMPDGWFSAEEGLAYRRWVERALSEPDARAHVVEVGCWLGRSCCYVARLCQAHGATLTCVDTWVRAMASIPAIASCSPVATSKRSFEPSSRRSASRRRSVARPRSSSPAPARPDRSISCSSTPRTITPRSRPTSPPGEQRCDRGACSRATIFPSDTRA
jgi:hypothetical protein